MNNEDAPSEVKIIKTSQRTCSLPRNLYWLKMATEQEAWPREGETREYLQTHKVLELFNNLTSQLIFKRPGRYFFHEQRNNRIWPSKDW